MDVDDLYKTDGEDVLTLQVHVQPGAGRSAIVGRHGDAVKVRVAAPPEGARANDACAVLLAEVFDTGDVELVGGEKSRSKQFRLSGVDLEEFARQLERAIEEGMTGPGPNSRANRH